MSPSLSSARTTFRTSLPSGWRSRLPSSTTNSQHSQQAPRWKTSNSLSPIRQYSQFTSGEAARARSATGPLNLKSVGLFLATGTGLYFYFRHQKASVEAKKREDLANKKVGRAKVGGPFQLTAHDGRSFSDQDLLGHFSLVYFGFTNCPDICPEELDKMGFVVDAIKSQLSEDVLPVFITCDPARDGPAQVAQYMKDFHPTMVGLTGSYEDIKKVCKEYRVYFSTPPNVKPGEDYLVDHSIFFYLMDPEGQFVEAFGRSSTKEEVSSKMGEFIKQWKSGVRWGKDS